MPYSDPQKRREYQAAYRVRNLDKRRAYQSAWLVRNRDHVANRLRENAYRRRYGITVADYDRMLLEQGGVCAICKTDKPLGRGERFHVDHDHVTNRVRGLLCHLCNTALGRVERYNWREYLGI